jgi:hypothetical protein
MSPPPPPPSANWTSFPSPLLDAGVATCCSHQLQLLATCTHVRSGGGASGDSPRAVGRRRPRVGGRGMQVRKGRWSASTGIRTPASVRMSVH